MKLFLIWMIAGLLTLNALYVTVKTSFTFGTFVLWAIIAGLAIYGVFHKQIDTFTKAGLGAIIKYVFFAGCAFFIGMFIFVAVSGYANTIQYNEQAYIVLGAGINGEQVSNILRRRLDAAIEAHRQNPDALIVVSGGKGSDEIIPEALAMQKYLLAQGIPEDIILMEDKSTSTEENLLFSRRLLEQRGIGPDAPVGVVTNAFHCYRAGKYAQRAGFTDARNLPASMTPSVLLIAYFREIFTVLYYWMFGGRHSAMFFTF